MKKLLIGIAVAVVLLIIAAVATVLDEPEHSYGFRPQRSAHQAVRELQAQVRQTTQAVNRLHNLMAGACSPCRASLEAVGSLSGDVR